ncbi:heme NO-binding domain-containing protein [Maritimibacter sp. UBA3975]|uniref:heme NO-binding domain-containing protein n=1 Tax=Maritimibacter sp. UBA3975 TaxID=1946833 RepID=UPI000C09F7D5|nr:heme NO-binding domain-containing protein [Maritimibacter sp. UBA3975]MAM62832.1 heme NO-binding protein [Maritimibacter sp.]|tara:strand:+ start:4086 stop:4691 length:606 start_codon:yes stop_codon:yes gene_type:complete
MHGIICRSFESFVRSAYGNQVWGEAAAGLDVPREGFEPMFHYDDDVVTALVAACAATLGKPCEALLEDFGTHLIAGMSSDRVRRLLRYGGIDYEDFLHSLDDLPGRAALAVPDLSLPELELEELDPGQYRLYCRAGIDGAGHVITGLLRALADDYGVLALLDHKGRRDGAEVICIRLLEAAFSKGRRFDLADTWLAVGGAP